MNQLTPTTTLKYTQTLVANIALKKFSESLQFLYHDEKHKNIFNDRILGFIQGIGREQSISHISNSSKMKSIEPNELGREIYVRIDQSPYFIRCAERNDKTVILFDIVYSGHSGWDSFMCLRNDILKARKISKN